MLSKERHEDRAAARRRDHEDEEAAVNPSDEQGRLRSALLGYLNFSDGRPDPRWQRQLSDAVAALARKEGLSPGAVLRPLLAQLRDSLRALQASGNSAFRDIAQAQTVLELAEQTLTAYQQHHADLFAHHDDSELFNAFFLARVCEAILAERARTDGSPDVGAVLHRLNDFIGYRPIAILETRPQGEPYDHERSRPLPLYLQGGGVAAGRYHDIVARALETLAATDPNLLTEAQFDLKLLDELAVDLRAYDHGHPVNRRPNYVFGEWDPHHLDNQGRYRRYVARKITLDALLERVDQAEPADREERLTEAAAVFAGTILMAAGVGGSGPTAYDSTVTLATLIPRIARYRDAFYEQLLGRIGGGHADRLRQEQATTRQPFGAARQHLNAYLARHRATQLQQRYLSLLFAEMGYPNASREAAGRIPTVSLRLLSEIFGRLTSGRVEVDKGQLRTAAARLPEVEDLLHRGIACGALADPWNILGFQGLFPLSPAREDSVRDPRLDELVHVVEQIFNLYARLMSEAAATGDGELVRTLGGAQKKLAAWWDHFATTSVSDIRHVVGSQAATSAANVAGVLAIWHDRGEATADLAFWRKHLDNLRSPKAFYLVIDTLLKKGDYRAALALLTHWLGNVEQLPLENGDYSFPNLALRWMLSLTRVGDAAGDLPAPPGGAPASIAARRDVVVKFFDYLEANAEEYWQVPALEIVENDEEEAEEDTPDLYGAAYDDVTYQDSTDDEEGPVSDGGPVQEFDLEREAERLEKRLRFLSTLARLWQIAARFIAIATVERKLPAPAAAEESPVAAWLTTARHNQQRLLALLDAVHEYPVPEPTAAFDSLVEFDRRRGLKEQLLYTTIGTCLDTSLAVSALRGASAALAARTAAAATQTPQLAGPEWEPAALRVEQALFGGEPAAAREAFNRFLDLFKTEPLLILPLAKGGSPRQLLRVRIAQTVLRALLTNLPRLGLLRETYELLQTARTMERAHPGRGQGVSEFNHFFQAGCQAVVESVVASAAAWDAEQVGDAQFVALLERLMTPFWTLWIEHSRTLQLSVLDTLASEAEVKELQSFIQHYGGDLFHARFMTLGNLRGILTRGVGAYLEHLADNPDPLHPVRLLDDLGTKVRREDAVRRLELVLQAVVENYEEYKDYNATTTQSDYGENLYVLLDFLRLKAAYERSSWHFRPLVLVHEVLARQGRNEAAVLWEQLLTRLTNELADQHLQQLSRLERARGVRLGTVSDRLNERFIKPLALDRLCALVEPAMLQADPGEGSAAFARLRAELQAYTATPTGVGLDVPFWLRRLELEVHRVEATRTTIAVLAENFFRVPRRPQSLDDVEGQLTDWDRPRLS
jgi:hypothetical protein